MIQGAIDFLISDTPEANYIKNCAIIKIIPMVNIDGVIVGNYRYPKYIILYSKDAH